MDLKETIKQQGTQASALLPELQEYVDSKVEELRGGGEYIVELSFKTFSGNYEDTKVTELKGRQNILAMWDKLEKGEIQSDKIKVVLRDTKRGYTYPAIQSLNSVEPNIKKCMNRFILDAFSTTRLFDLVISYNGGDFVFIQLHGLDGEEFNVTSSNFTD